MNSTDYTLLLKIRSGDRPAFMILYERYWNNLYSFTFARTRDKNASEDLLQNLWIKLLENPEIIQTDHQESAKGYLLRYLHYRIIDHYNNNKTQRTEDPEDLYEEMTDEEYIEILEENDIHQLFDMVNTVVSQLTQTEQKVYDLRIRKNLSVAETASVLGLSNKTVSNNLSKVLSEIRDQLKPKYKSSKKLISVLMWLEIVANAG